MADVAEAAAPTRKEPRHHKRRHRRVQQAQSGSSAAPAAVDPAASEAGPSKLPLAPVQVQAPAVSATPKAKSKSKAGDEQSKGDQPLVNAKHDRAGKTEKLQGDRWDAVPVAQSAASSIPPVWSNDGRFYFTAANTSIYVHSATAPTFNRLSTLSSTHPQGHRQKITALVLHPTNPLQLLSASLDGTLKVWDWVEGRLVLTTTYVEGASLSCICPVDIGGKWWVLASVTNPKPGKRVKDDGSHLQHRLMRVPLAGAPAQPAASSTDKPIAYLYLVGKLRHAAVSISVSPRTTYVAAFAGRKAYVYRLPQAGTIDDDRWKPTCVKFVSDIPFTCGLFAPERRVSGKDAEEWFATGDERGVVRLWHGLADAFRQLDAAPPGVANDPRRLPTTMLHWHAHAVGALAFSPSGAQLLSVGEESVLVQWHLSSGRREYIPRLGGAAILSIAVHCGARGSEDEYWLGFADSSVVRVGAATGTVSTVGQGIRIDPRRPSADRPYPLAVHPPSKALVVPSSHPSTLQFIDPLTSSVLFDLEVAPSNRVSRRDEKALEPVGVERVAFSADGAWLATTEGRRGDAVEGGGRVMTLKLWKWDGERYIVNTQYPHPHGPDDVSSLAFGGAGGATYLLTTGGETAKLWQTRQAGKSEHGKTASKKPATYNTFSPDGTLVTLVHPGVISLWDGNSNVLLRALDSGSKLQQITFTGEGRYLVGASAAKGVTVWDLLSCEDQLVDQLVSTPDGFATLSSTSTHTAVASFDSSGNLIRHAHVAIDTQHALSYPSSSIHLISVASSGEITRFGPSESTSSATARAVGSAAAPAREAHSVWQEMFGKDAFLADLDTPGAGPSRHADDAHRVTALQARARGRPADVFAGPSHTMPPTSMLFDAFMDELLDVRSEQEVDQAADGVIYEEEQAAVAGLAVVSPVAEYRDVKDDDVKELEVFFRNLLTTKTTAAAPPAPTSMQSKSFPHTKPLPKPNGLPNGLPNGVAHHVNGSTPRKVSALGKAVLSTPTMSTPGGQSVNGTATPGDEPADDTATPERGGRKKSKKRKAPRAEAD